jgi:hypothetical protein
MRHLDAPTKTRMPLAKLTDYQQWLVLVAICPVTRREPTESVLRKTMVAQLNTDAVFKKKSLDELRGKRRLADHLRSRRGLQGRRDPEEARDHEPESLVDAMLPQGCRRRNPVEELGFQATAVRETGFIGGGTKQADLLAPRKATGPCLARVSALERPLLRARPD